VVGETEDVMAKRMHGGLLAGAAVLALAALGAVVLAGCGSGEPAEKSSAVTVEVTPPAEGATTVMEARVGDTVIVSLAANATTGYEWTFSGGDTFSIDKSEYVPDPNPDELLGKGGTQVVTLKVTRAGESDLTGTYARSWETPEPGAGPDVTVTIKSTD
jgi:inhibitor of cysteine peptidase